MEKLKLVCQITNKDSSIERLFYDDDNETFYIIKEWLQLYKASYNDAKEFCLRSGSRDAYEDYFPNIDK